MNDIGGSTDHGVVVLGGCARELAPARQPIEAQNGTR